MKIITPFHSKINFGLIKNQNILMQTATVYYLNLKSKILEIRTDRDNQLNTALK